jgi:ubiquinone/menaquinone biosynthesis C-methylase UbiE
VGEDRELVAVVQEVAHERERRGLGGFFGEDYLRTFIPFLDEERTRAEALGAIRLAGIEAGAEVLDCPVGFGRHAILLADEGYRVTGVDISRVQLAEAERRRGDREWPRLVRADYRSLPFADASFDCALNLFTALGYLGRDDDQVVLSELRRVLRPGGPLIVETMHRDRVVRTYRPRVWDELPDGGFVLQEHEWEPLSSTVRMRHVLVTSDGELRERRAVHRLYTVTELAELGRAAGFSQVEALGGWDGEPMTVETPRVVLRLR